MVKNSLIAHQRIYDYDKNVTLQIKEEELDKEKLYDTMVNL